jgi:hypothetical protein
MGGPLLRFALDCHGLPLVVLAMVARARTTFGREDAPRDGMHPAVQIEAPRSRVSGVSCRVGTRRLPC